MQGELCGAHGDTARDPWATVLIQMGSTDFTDLEGNSIWIGKQAPEETITCQRPKAVEVYNSCFRFFLPSIHPMSCPRASARMLPPIITVNHSLLNTRRRQPPCKFAHLHQISSQIMFPQVNRLTVLGWGSLQKPNRQKVNGCSFSRHGSTTVEHLPVTVTLLRMFPDKEMSWPYPTGSITSAHKTITWKTDSPVPMVLLPLESKDT